VSGVTVAVPVPPVAGEYAAAVAEAISAVTINPPRTTVGECAAAAADASSGVTVAVPVPPVAGLYAIAVAGAMSGVTVAVPVPEAVGE